ncbi:MAG: DEAD/DEAH box helicase [Nocardioidaceae bacterium]|nr:DEAD/DEAH box helicase [Nocardioidaceae bacterium]
MSLHNRKSLEPWISDDVRYYEHQAEGVRYMAQRRSVLLADDMGLGKSLQTLTTFAIDVKRGRSETMIVVCPASLKVNWIEETEKFTKFPVSLLDGSPKKRKAQLADFAADTGPRILVINYEQIKPHLRALNEIHFDIAAFDEAHYMKNYKAARTKAAAALISRRSLLLTGSPLLNHVNELWPLLDRISPGEWGGYWAFARRFCVFGGFEGKQIIGVKNEKELTARLQNVMLRRLKKDVLDLPEVQYIRKTIDLHERQRTIYRQVLSEMKLDTGGGDDPQDIDNVLTKFLRLKQICGTTASVMEDGSDYSLKLDAAVEDARQIVDNGERIVAFTQFRSVQEAYAKRLQGNGNIARGVPVYILNGDVPSAPDGKDPKDPSKRWSRQEIVHQWANADEPGVIVAMFQVAGVGLNMTAARYGQFLDKLFVPALNSQAVDRMHRIGADETHPVQILEYITRDTVEERVEKILSAKHKVFTKIIEKDPWSDKLLQSVLEEELKSP